MNLFSVSLGLIGGFWGGFLVVVIIGVVYGIGNCFGVFG